MSVQDLIIKLRTLDVKLWVENEKLRYSAPSGVMTDAYLKQLAENKQAIIEWLRRAVRSNEATTESIKKVSRGQALETSFAQERLLFIAALMPGTDSYNVPLPIRLVGELDQSALQKTLNTIIDRHESLRTHFVNKNGQYLQLIEQSLAMPLTYFSLTDYEKNERDEKLKELVRQERKRPFDLDTGPVIRATLIKLSENEHALLITIHHIVCDGWSLSILFNELSRLYSAYSTGTDIEIPPLKIQYADYAVWQRQLLSGDTLQREVSYWLNKLDGLSTLQLPTDFSRPQIQTFEGGHVARQLPDALTSAIKQLSEQAGATLFMTMLAAFSVLLKHYCQQDDIVIGTPISNRNRVEIEELIGFFINMLVLRTDLSGSPTFNTLLKRVKDTALEAYQHQDLSFEKLVEELNTERDLSRNPLFQVAFSMQNTPKATVQLQGLNFEQLQTDEATTTRFDLEINLRESGNKLVIDCVYNTRLFRKETITRMLGHYQQLLNNIVADPNQTVDTLQILTDEECQKILYQWNQTQQPLPHNRLIHQSVEKIAAEYPTHPGIISDGKSFDYAAINQSANQLAHYLLELGACSSTPVTVLMNRTADMVIALLAILKTGSHYVPVDPKYPEKRLAYILDDTKSNIVITQSDLSSRVSSFFGHVVRMDDIVEKLQDYSELNPEVSVSPENTAYIIYTSGSTGEPKGVEIIHAGLSNLVAWHQREYQPGINDRATHLAGLGFDASVWELWPYISCGTCIYLVPDELKLLASALWQWIVTNGITLSFMPTPLAEAVLAEITPDSLAKPEFALRVLLTGGDKLHGGLFNRVLPFRVVNHYGPTENTVVATSVDVDVLDKNEPAIGRPIDNVQIYILDKHLQAVPVGVKGNLYIGGNSLAKGYLNQENLNAEKFVKNPFSKAGNECLYDTGDLAKYREDGMIEFSGRSDSQIKLRGFRVEPGEIEALLNQHQGVQSAAVLIHGEKQNDSSDTSSATKQLIAYVVLNGTVSCSEDDLLSDLQQKIPAYMVPSFIMFMDEFPFTPNGKLDRNALPVPEIKQYQTHAHKAPDSELEKSIAAIWSDLLDLNDVGIRDNFFDLGGHSLLLGKLHSRLKEDLGANIAMVDLFRYTTVESLARYMGGDTLSSNIDESLIQRMQQRRNNATESEIAVVGMAGQFPGSPDVDIFWQNLIDGVESIHFFSDEELIAAGISESTIQNHDFVPARGYLEGAELFDAAFFGYSPHEAELIDPQQRLFLECSWHALEHAACDPQTYNGLIGVFAGTSMNGYLQNLYSRPDLLATAGMQVVISSEKDFLATRVSYKLDLKGPSFTLQTACSTSLVAIHEACRSLQNYDNDVVLAGGVSVKVPRVSGYTYQQGSILSPDGHCRAFDAEANGTVGGEGVGVVVLKRLKDAISDRDTIHAVIKGSAINNDGADKAGYTAPSIQGQVNVIAMAQAAADITADTVDYIETHGTGTTLGDPIEVSALTQAFTNGSSEHHLESKQCALGAVKTNIGHLDAAAGVAGFIKTVLSIKYAQIPPSLNYTAPNPEIDFDNCPFYVNKELSSWPSSNNGPRRAGISSFGIGGTNAHIIVEQPPEVEVSSKSVSQAEQNEELIVLSAKTSSALELKMSQLAEHLQVNPELSLHDIAYTLQHGRSMFEHRCMLVTSQTQHLSQQLLNKSADTVVISAGNVASKKIVFMFSGQGAQYPNMGKDLYLGYELFRNTVDTCCELLKPYLQSDLLELLYPDEEKIEYAAQQLSLTRYAQCALFVIEYATAKLWMSWGIKPEAMIGHSIGEYVAACISGVISLHDVLVLVANRGRLMQAQPSGSMMSISLNVDKVQSIIPDKLKQTISIATINAPSMCVVSGEDNAINSLEQILIDKKYNVRRLHTSHAFHSPMMEDVLVPFEQLFDRVRLKSPTIPFISNLTGEWISDHQATDAKYWAQHLRNTVLFSNGLKTLLDEKFNCYIETGPGNTLATFARQHASYASEALDLIVLSSIRHPRQKQKDNTFLLNTLGQLWLAGHPLEWNVINEMRSARHIALPGYPFDRKRYWVEPNIDGVSQSMAPTNRQHKFNDIDKWAYIPVWKSSLMYRLDEATDLSGRWIIFASNSVSCQEIISYLEQYGAEVIRITPASDYASLSPSHYTLNPSCKAHFDKLLADDNIQSTQAHRIIHCWGLNKNQGQNTSLTTAIIENEYYSLLYLVQAMISVWSDSSLHIDVLTQFSQSVNGQEIVIPEKTMSTALLKVMSQEVAGLTYNIYDFLDKEIEPHKNQNSKAPVLPEVLQCILTTYSRHTVNQLIAYRFNRRWVQSYDAVELTDINGENLPTRLRKKGVYLITGGLGGVGLSIAHYLASKVQARLILTARTALPDRAEWNQYIQAHDDSDKVYRILHQIQQLEISGAEVMVAAVDVNDMAAMQALLNKVTIEYGQIHGVIHAAGVVSGSSMVLMHALTSEDCEQQFIPKVHGLMVLKQLFDDCPPDFIMLVSSLSTVLGGLGFAAYSAANQFMDSMCQQQHNMGQTHWLSVDWEGWKFEPNDIGTSTSADAAEGSSSALMLSVSEGQQVFERILNLPRLAQLIISTGDLETRLKQWIYSGVNKEIDGSTGGAIEKANYERPVLSSNLVEAETETQKEMSEIWVSLFNIKEIGIHDNFFELGGHSLLAVQAVAVIREKFDANLTIDKFLELGTVEKIASHIDALKWIANDLSDKSASVDDNRNEFEL